MEPHKPPPLSRPKYRPDIDGLRAVAILSVVLFHVFPDGLKGGFVGVDIFFVISGYLITGIIFEELDEGAFSFAAFFGRRIRRILPALILVMSVSLAFGWFALLAEEYEQLGKHAFGGAALISNFIFSEEAVRYFTNENETKPFLHLWSLAVEEQFYILWPLTLWLAWKGKINLLTLTLAFAFLSFAINVMFVGLNPVETFYWPGGRFWELLLGSVLAWLTLYKCDTLSKARLWIDRKAAGAFYPGKAGADGSIAANFISILGLLTLAFAVTQIHEGLNFPGLWALAPVFGAILVIAAGPKAYLNRILLMNPVAVWIGLISYPLYLWHWPILSYFRILENEAPHAYLKIGGVVAAIGLAWVTYELIEKPFRFHFRKTISSSILIMGLIAIGIFGYVVERNEGIKSRFSEFVKKNERLFSQIRSRGPLENQNCRSYFADFREGLCVMEHAADPTVLLLGDSHALQLYPGLVGRWPQQNIVMLGGGWGGKHQGAMNPILSGTSPLRDQVYKIVENTTSIHTVVIAYMADDLSSDSYVRTFNKLKEMGKNVVYVYDIPPLPFDPRACFDSRPFRISNKIKDPCAYPKNIYLGVSSAYRNNVKEALVSTPFVRTIDLSSILCDETNCYAMRGEKLLYSTPGKNSHLSIDGSIYVGEFVSKFLNDLWKSN